MVPSLFLGTTSSKKLSSKFLPDLRLSPLGGSIESHKNVKLFQRETGIVSPAFQSRFNYW
jgi:hypothetical protein